MKVPFAIILLLCVNVVLAQKNKQLIKAWDFNKIDSIPRSNVPVKLLTIESNSVLVCQEFWMNGNLKSTALIHDGKLVQTFPVNDNAGNPLALPTIQKGKGWWFDLDERGSIIAKRQVQNGFFKGDFVLFDTIGNIIGKSRLSDSSVTYCYPVVPNPNALGGGRHAGMYVDTMMMVKPWSQTLFTSEITWFDKHRVVGKTFVDKSGNLTKDVTWHDGEKVVSIFSGKQRYSYYGNYVPVRVERN